MGSSTLGLYVAWGQAYEPLQAALETHRRSAEGKDGELWQACPAGQCIVRPYGKGANFRYAAEFPGVHLYFAAQDKAEKTPNVYASPSARMLWRDGVTETVEAITHIIRELGGEVMGVQPSRCDLAADFIIPEKLTLEFLRQYRVCRSRATNHWEDAGELHTFYLGKKSAPIQCRIYNKLVQVMNDAKKAWFIDLWELNEVEPVWRVEFQLRRSILRELGIHSVEDLLAQAGGIWQYLTSQWLTLREPGETNTSRRPVHLWWRAVQDCASLFGPACDIRRNLPSHSNVDAQWYESHAAGCFLSWAARKGWADLDLAMLAFSDAILKRWDEKGWAEGYAKKRIELDLDGDGKEGDGAPI